MTNYDDYTEWKEVHDWENQEILQQSHRYSPQDIFDICERLIEEAENSGLEGYSLVFESSYEDYEDSLGSPSVTVVGYRPLNETERKQLASDNYVKELAKERGITEYQAKNLLELVKLGVVKDLPF